ncbi:putative inositol monophosphatase 3 [Lamellibrachia satsuma]|nr:putative inositol monophosphatase 3 [Lamellibrachia satsuma]
MKELLSVSIDVAERGGVRVKVVREGSSLDETSKGKTKEGVNDVLTAGDLQSHLTMMNGFQKAFPGLKVISEEHTTQLTDFKIDTSVPKKNSDEVKSLTHTEKVRLADITVWIDPLDATKEYSENLRQYVTTMVCVAVKGVPVIGVIHRPFTGETAWAYVGVGQSKNLQVAKKEDLGGKGTQKIIVSMSHAGSVKELALKKLGDNVEIVSAAGAGYKTLEVVKGTVNAYVHTTRIKKWDICAGNAIMRAVGGNMTTLKGSRVDYSGAGSPINDNGLLATLTEHAKYLVMGT